ncbi:hypothetical protein [Sulfuracidifex metallicus]|nr:hypothetical protein [Sulfuracidifex metallicus]MCY0850445.1 hypothetical protein [Sulfuracidifex metallicus]
MSVTKVDFIFKQASSIPPLKTHLSQVGLIFMASFIIFSSCFPGISPSM